MIYIVKILQYFFHYLQLSSLNYFLNEILLQNQHLQIDVYDLRLDIKMVSSYNKSKELSICVLVLHLINYFQLPLQHEVQSNEKALAD